MLSRFDTLTEFATAAQAAGDPFPDEFGGWESATWPESLELARRGSDELASRAERMMADFEINAPETRAIQTVRATFAGRCDIGSYLAGDPNPVRRRVRRPSEAAPIRIFVSCCYSAAVSRETIETRGAAILALAARLQQSRPVDLYGFFELGSSRLNGGFHYSVVRLESRPIALAHAAFLLAHPAAFRKLGFAVAKRNGWTGGWPEGYWDQNYKSLLRQRLGVTDSDVLIETIISGELLSERPADWLRDQIARIEGRDE